MASSDPDSFPIEARVLLQDLVKAPELNGKVGVIKSTLSDAGRQTVYVHELKRSMNVKLPNLRYEPRPVESLSIKELKLVLQTQKIVKDDSEMVGLDKADLQAKLKAKQNTDEEIAGIIANAQAAETSPPKPKNSSTVAPSTASVNPAQAADQLSSMNPEQLRQQARMMRSMPPSQIRSMNPALRNMSDAQIRMAADQMEMMANNPTMIQSAAQQMKNMDPSELERMQNQMTGGAAPTAASTATTASSPAAGAAQPTTTTTTPSPTAGNTANQAQLAAEAMKNMTPEQLKQQAEMLRNMDPSQVRAMNPQMATMSDEQIKMAATQFEMMASNPAMLEMALNQMKNVDPAQMADMKRNGGMTPPAGSGVPGVSGGATPPAGMDPAAMLANMDKDQLKTMLQSLKENPEMMKQFAQMTGVTEEQLAKGVDMFTSMDDNKLDATLKTMQKVQQAKDIWTKADTKTGGKLKYILIATFILFVGTLFWLIFLRGIGAGAASSSSPLGDEEIPNIAVETAKVAEDEFASEF